MPLQLGQQGRRTGGQQGPGLAGKSVLLKLVSQDLKWGEGVGSVSMCFWVVSATCLLFLAVCFHLDDIFNK